jgi:hypothetical protein
VARWPVAAGAITLGCVALLVLHAFEPPGPFTWAYAHLGRRPELRVVAALVVAVLPPLVGWLWRRPWASAPVAALGARRVVPLVALGTVAVTAVGLRWPVTPICIDAWYFATSVGQGTTGSPRWYLTLWTFGTVAPLLHAFMAPFTVVRAMNCMVAAGALAALAAASRTLGRTEGEAAALTAVVWTSFGVLQLVLGYVDVYPTALCWTALYLWAGSAVLLRDRHPLWPMAVAAVAPFFYVGLVLLAPSCLVVLGVAARRHGSRRALEALAVAVVLAGLATWPGYGMPFAWQPFARELAPALAPGAPIDGRGALLPVREIASAWHWLGIVHLFVLVDGLGVLLLAACGPTAIRRAPRPLVVWGAALLAPSLAYVVTMDPLFGLFADWDLFSYVAAITAMCGAYAFVVWGRGAPRRFAPLLGLVLATALVHLIARLNALDVDFHRHLAETPFRIPVTKPAPGEAGS